MHKFELIDLDPPPDVPAEQRQAGQRLAKAKSDTEVARDYLHHLMLRPTTMKSTKTDLCRFLLWCRDKELRLADLGVAEMAAYRDFLIDPQPREKWVSEPKTKPGDADYKPDQCGTRWPRTDPRWRPFSGPLSPQSARQAFRVARALTTYATDTGHLELDPGKIVKNFRVQRHAQIERYLGPATIAYVDIAIAQLPRAPGNEARTAARDQFLFVAFVTTGARLSEIAEATMGACQRDHDGRWWLQVTGKGEKTRRLPVCAELLECYSAYREQFGLPPTTHRRDETPLVLSVRRRQLTGIGAEATSNVITRLFGQAAEVARLDDNLDAHGDLLEASAHWLRHEMLTALVNHTGELKTAQDQGGHVDITTTGAYLHRQESDRHDMVLELMKRRR